MRDQLISFLKDQHHNGFFTTYSITGNTKREINTPFFSYLIGSILHTTNNPELYLLKEKLAASTRAQMSSKGTYNYWINDSEETIKYTLPDDWDDTALAIATLSFSTEQAWQLPLQKLRNALNENQFQTWVTSEGYREQFPRWSEEDPYVNLNILYALAINGILLPNVWLATISKKPDSKYYLANGMYEFLMARLHRFYSHQKPHPLNLKHTLTSRIFSIATNSQYGFTTPPDVLDKCALKLLTNPHDPCILGWQEHPTLKTYDYSPALLAVLLLTAYKNQDQAYVSNSHLHTQLATTAFGKELIHLPKEINQNGNHTKLIEQNLLWWSYYYPYDARIDGQSIPFPVQRPIRTVSSPHFTKALKTYLNQPLIKTTPKGWQAYYAAQHAPYIAAVLQSGSSRPASYSHYLIAKQLADDLIDLPEDTEANRISYCTHYLKTYPDLQTLKKHISHVVLCELSRAKEVPAEKLLPIRIAALRTLRILREEAAILAPQSSIPNGRP